MGTLPDVGEETQFIRPHYTHRSEYDKIITTCWFSEDGVEWNTSSIIICDTDIGDDFIKYVLEFPVKFQNWSFIIITNIITSGGDAETPLSGG